MGRQTTRTNRRKSPKRSKKGSQKETKAKIGQRLAEFFRSKLMSFGVSRKGCKGQAPVQQRDEYERKTKEMKTARRAPVKRRDEYEGKTREMKTREMKTREMKTREMKTAKRGTGEEPLLVPDEVTGYADMTKNGSSASTAFNIDEVSAGVVILGLISGICKQAGKPSIEERKELRDMFNLMPYLLTPEGRRQERVSSLQFLTAVYENPESTNWGAIESFDHLQLVLEELEKFDSRAEVEPREGSGGVFIV